MGSQARGDLIEPCHIAVRSLQFSLSEVDCKGSDVLERVVDVSHLHEMVSKSRYVVISWCKRSADVN